MMRNRGWRNIFCLNASGSTSTGYREGSLLFVFGLHYALRWPDDRRVSAFSFADMSGVNLPTPEECKVWMV